MRESFRLNSSKLHSGGLKQQPHLWRWCCPQSTFDWKINSENVNVAQRQYAFAHFSIRSLLQKVKEIHKGSLFNTNDYNYKSCEKASGSTILSSTSAIYNSNLTSEDVVVLNLLLIENSTQKTLMPPWDNMHSYIFQLEASFKKAKRFIKDHQSIQIIIIKKSWEKATGSTAASSTPVVYNSDLSSEDDVVLNLDLIENSTRNMLMPPWDNMQLHFSIKCLNHETFESCKEHQ